MKKMIILTKRSIRHSIITLFVCTFSLPAMAGGNTDTIIYRERNGPKFIVVDGEEKGNIGLKIKTSDSTKIIVTDGTVFKFFRNKKYYSDFFVDLGYNRLDKRNMFTDATSESATGFPKLRNSASMSFAMYAMFGRQIVGSLSVMSGLGIDWVNYKFSKEVTFKDINDIATQVPIESVINNFSYMKKSKLTGSYLEVPLMLKLRFNRFFVAAGVTGGLNIGSHTKVVFVDTNGKKQTYKDYDIHLATFRYGYAMRAGFRHFSLFVNYYVSPLFPKDEGPQVYPFTMGLSLRLW
jgi:hypothetical protein